MKSRETIEQIAEEAKKLIAQHERKLASFTTADLTRKKQRKAYKRIEYTLHSERQWLSGLLWALNEA